MCYDIGMNRDPGRQQAEGSRGPNPGRDANVSATALIQKRYLSQLARGAPGRRPADDAKAAHHRDGTAVCSQSKEKQMFAYKQVFCLGLALGIAAFAATAQAQSNPTNGKTLYLANCNSCHGFPNYPLVQKASVSSVLQTAIATKVPKMNIPALTGLSAANLGDIAAYLNTMVGAGFNNYQGLWWVPAAAEDGWGINFAHQGDLIFATWYTYDSTGKPWWLTMLTTRTSATSNVYSGPVYVDTGPPFNAFVGSGTPTAVGIGTITFTDRDNGVLSYAVGAGGGNVQQIKQITRFQLNTPGSNPPVCTYGATSTSALKQASNYQDLWWAASGTESGWGINFAHQGSQIYATWYTYAPNNQPVWLAALATQTTGQQFSGQLLQVSGPRFDAYDKTQRNPPLVVGSMTLNFTNGNAGTLSYTTNGTGGLPAVTQTKTVTRFLFGPSAATLCR